MSIVQEIIKLNMDFNDTQEEYHYIPMSNEYQNYKRQKNEHYDLLRGLVNGAANSVSNALLDTLKKSFDDTIPKTIDEAVKQAIKGNPNMSWKD